MAFLENLQDLKIPIRDIELATKNFTTIIGKGGYGPVYKGEISLSGKLTSVAVKRLIINLSGQGLKEFLTEIQLLSRYKHPNLVSLLGFCEQGDEKTLIYEYAVHGSLDKYLSMPKTTNPLTWKQRLRICIDAARGLDYLHNRVAEKHRIIHRDIKSANILLDHNFKAMISDFGLSKIGRADESETFLITNVCGTYGYCDPAYVRTGVLTKESDVYSFGVVLFEVLCGRLCFINVNDERRFLAPMAQRYFEEGKLQKIIDPDLNNQINTNSLTTFTEIAYQCLQIDREQRPSMDLVVRKLEEASMFQDIKESNDTWLMDYEQISRTLDSPLIYDTKEELYSHLRKGILVDGGNLWICVNNNGKYQEMISAMKFMCQCRRSYTTISEPKSRFGKVVNIVDASKLNIQIKIRTRFLSLGVTYAAYVVFKSINALSNKLPVLASLKYKLNGTSESNISYLVELKDDGWMMIELFQTSNIKRNVDFEVMLEGLGLDFESQVSFEGIEFLPIQKFDNEEVDRLEMENLLTSTMDRENQLPYDYEQFIYYSSEEMMKIPREDVVFPTKEEAYSILSTGVRIKGYRNLDIWFWVSKSNGKKCFMLAPESFEQILYDANKFQCIPSNESRFEKVVHVISASDGVRMTCGNICNLLSTKTTYGCYLVYKIPQGLIPEHPVLVKIWTHSDSYRRMVYWVRPKSPVIGTNGQMRPSSPVNRPQIKGIPRMREDGWWEVMLGEFVLSTNETSHDPVSGVSTLRSDRDSLLTITMSPVCHNILNFTMQGIEFRPL